MRGGYTHEVIHVSGTEQKDAVVVGKLSFVYVGAVSTDMSTIIDVVVVIHKPDASDPVPSLLGPVCIGLVVGVASQPCTEVEEAAVCDAWRLSVLIAVASATERRTHCSCNRIRYLTMESASADHRCRYCHAL